MRERTAPEAPRFQRENRNLTIARLETLMHRLPHLNLAPLGISTGNVRVPVSVGPWPIVVAVQLSRC
jgi:hypothetical protein